MESSSQGAQDFCVYTNEAPISEPFVKHSALLQACGEAKYSQDLAMSSHDVLHGVYIFNTEHAHAKFEIQLANVYENFPTVVRVFTAEDIDPDVSDANNPPLMHHRHSNTTQAAVNKNDLGEGFPDLPSCSVFAKEEVSESTHMKQN